MRRSTRGGPPPPPASATSSSSLSSARPDRTSRAHIPNPKSTTPHSLSSEEELPRRSQRAAIPLVKPPLPRHVAGTAEDAGREAGEEEEVTRCVCGNADYPGPPEIDIFAGLVDAGDLFIQCDDCGVWQHGGCVSIAEEAECPDQYFCEACKPSLHIVHQDPKGQRYSLYLPLHPRARKPSLGKHDEKSKKDRDAALSRASVDPSTGKRRATMRSKEHDDEEEQLKRAIEESKREVEDTENNGRRSGKRSRDDSEDSKQDLKRQRTASESLPSGTRTASLGNESEDGETTPTAGKLKKAKTEASNSARQAAQKERDQERERVRAEAAGRRQERAGRRRADESDIVEELTPKPTPSAHASPPPSSSLANSPPPANEKGLIRKGPGKKTKKLGNNQYTKSRGESAMPSPQLRKRQLAGNGSGDDAPSVTTNGETSHTLGRNSPPANASTIEASTGKGKFGRGKKGASSAAANGNGIKSPGEEVEKTFSNMKTAIEAMSRWVARQQVDLPAANKASLASNDALAASDPARKFEDLSSLEMMEQFQKEVARWQEKYGHLA